MPILPTFILPKNILSALRRTSNHVAVSPLLAEVAACDAEAVFRRLQTGEGGLSEEEAPGAWSSTAPTLSPRNSGTGGCGSWAMPASIRW